ncbi:MAG: NapC/NirT family cytochrome c [Siculibacillus sp.]|nr:NapC/NirT family cytochrome c [Siculibacillus sp.]
MAGLISKLASVWAALRRPSVKFSILTLTVGGFVGGIFFWGGFNTAMEATNSKAFCISCHEMRDTVFKEYEGTIHAANRTGVSAMCSDCHVPKDWTHKILRKIQASQEVWGKLTGSISTPEKFDAKRLTLAKHEWERMKASDSRECRNCHTFEGMNPENQRPRARKQHMAAMESGNTCIDCHKGIAHKNIRDRLTDAEMEALEKPVAAFARPIPATYKDGLARAEAKEAAAEKAKQAEITAAAETIASNRIAEVRAEIEKAAEAKIAAAKATATGAPTAAEAAPAPAAAPAASTGGVDWTGVKAQNVNLFYPGIASHEWVQTGRDHGGARTYLKSGDRCAECHLKETKEMGAKIVSGEKAEPTPIPGKRGNVDVAVQSVFDADKLHFRFQWKNVAHVPVPFAEGGKLDPTNQVKLAVTLSKTEGIERIDQAGCWTSCHSDARSMPDTPKGDALKAGPAELNLADGVRKYLADTRTEVDLKGDSGTRGGWNKLKPAADVDALLKAGSFLDLMRFRSGGAPEHGYVLADRIMEGGSPIEATGTLDGDTWTVTMSRALKAGTDKELTIESGKTYIIGIALHDDHASARFHHVSLALKFGLGVSDAEIVAIKK